MSMNHCAWKRAAGRAVPSFLNSAGPSEDVHAHIVENIALVLVTQHVLKHLTLSVVVLRYHELMSR